MPADCGQVADEEREVAQGEIDDKSEEQPSDSAIDAEVAAKVTSGLLAHALNNAIT